MWLDNSFKKYKKAGLYFVYEKVENELIEDEIDIQSIRGIDINLDFNDVEKWEDEMQIASKIDEIIRAIKQLDNKIKEKQC